MNFQDWHKPLIRNPEVRWPGPLNGPLLPIDMTHPVCAGCGEYLGLYPGEWKRHKNGCSKDAKPEPEYQI